MPSQVWSLAAPPPEVVELVDQEAMEQQCLGRPREEALGLAPLQRKQLCFLAFLPNILDSGASGRNRQVPQLFCCCVV